jgi:hypothetical protein
MTSLSNHNNYIILSIQECRELYKLFERQYIDYDNAAGHAVVNRICAAIKDYDGKIVDRGISPSEG